MSGLLHPALPSGRGRCLGKDPGARGRTDPAQAHRSAPAPVLWGLQSSALPGEPQLRGCAGCRLRTPQCCRAVRHHSTASLRRCALRSALGKATWRSIRGRASPAPPCPAAVFGSPRLSAMHRLHATRRCLGCASLQASSRSWSAVALFDSKHTEGDNISLQLFFLPLLAWSAGCFVGCLYSQG